MKADVLNSIKETLRKVILISIWKALIRKCRPMRWAMGR